MLPGMIPATALPRGFSTIWDSGDNGGFSLVSKVATSSGSSARSVKGTVGFSAGKRYFEVSCPSTSEWGAGFADKTTINPTSRGGQYSVSAGAWRGGASNAAGETGAWTLGDATTPSFTSGVLGFALDLDNGRAYLRVNGTWLGSSDPVAGTTPWITGISGPVYPCGTSTSSPRVLTLKTKDAEFSNARPSGYLSWDGN